MTIPTYTSPIPRIHIARFSSAIGRNYYINGASQTLIPATGAVATNGLVYYDGRIGLSAPRTNEFYYYEGDIGEIIIFNKYVSDSEREDIEEYLGTKWGITVP